MLKKKILLIVLVVCLVLGGVGGVVYANLEHEPVLGDKLVGVCWAGTMDHPELGDYQLYPYFRITNPNCDSDIEDIHVSIIRGDGFSVYEGELNIYGSDPTSVMVPHQTTMTTLAQYIPWELFSEPPIMYSIEISFEAAPDAAPLIGWQVAWTNVVRNDGIQRNDHIMESPMVNLTVKKHK